MLIDLAQLVRSSLRLHPRVVYQKLGEDDARARLAAIVPTLVPFGPKPYAGMIAILDWDHRLPSKRLFLRVFAYTSTESLGRGEANYAHRVEEIAAQDRFPEFDVPDFDGLLADESYEGEWVLDQAPSPLHLVSGWRRDFSDVEAKQAVDIARRSEEFQKIRAETAARPAFLGDLEAVAWCPPCESGHSAWSVDVWYLTSFDGQIGQGHSLLVSLKERRVLATRGFSVRAT